MRRCLGCLLFPQLFFFISIFAQQPDTTSFRYDSARTLVEKTVKEWQDSIAQKKQLEQIQKNSKPLDVFLAEMKEKERKEKRRQWIRIGAGALLLFALFFALARRSQLQRRRS